MDENPYRGPQADGSGPPPQPKSGISSVFNVLVVLGIIGLVIVLLLPAVRTTREPARRNACTNKLKQIGLALSNYEQVHHALPPAYTVDADGKPLHSWRTLILPYLEEGKLYKSIDLTKPWNDPVNAEAFKTVVDAYLCPSSVDPPNYTTYMAIVGPHNCFRPDEPRRLAEITDGASQTLMVIEVGSEHAVPWMTPVDANEQMVLDIGPESKLAHRSGVQAAFVDGSVRLLAADTPKAQRRALISIAGGDKVVLEDLH